MKKGHKIGLGLAGAVGLLYLTFVGRAKLMAYNNKLNSKFKDDCKKSNNTDYFQSKKTSFCVNKNSKEVHRFVYKGLSKKLMADAFNIKYKESELREALEEGKDVSYGDVTFR